MSMSSSTTLTKRRPHYSASSNVYHRIEEGKSVGLFSVLSLSTVFYILANNCGKPKAIQLIKLIRDVLNLVEAPTQTANLAIDSGWDDFEDALQYYSAVHSKADCIITRNPRDFRKSKLPVYTPEEYLQLQK